MDRFKIFCAVHLIILDKGKVLLQRRNNPKKYGYKMLALPAGHLEENENVYDAMRREAKEELGITITNMEIVQVMNLKGDTGIYDAYFFLCNSYDGIISNKEPWNATIEWHEINENIEKEVMPYNYFGLKKYLENKSNYFTIYGWDKK